MRGPSAARLNVTKPEPFLNSSYSLCQSARKMSRLSVLNMSRFDGCPAEGATGAGQRAVSAVVMTDPCGPVRVAGALLKMDEVHPTTTAGPAHWPDKCPLVRLRRPSRLRTSWSSISSTWTPSGRSRRGGRRPVSVLGLTTTSTVAVESRTLRGRPGEGRSDLSTDSYATQIPAIQVRLSRFCGMVQQGPVQRQKTQIVQPCK